MEVCLLCTKRHSNTTTPYHPRELNIQRPSLPFCPPPFLFSLQSCSGRSPAQQAFATSAAWVFSSTTPSRFLGSSARLRLLAAPISSPPSAAAFSLYVPPSKCLCLLGGGGRNAQMWWVCVSKHRRTPPCHFSQSVWEFPGSLLSLLNIFLHTGGKTVNFSNQRNRKTP